jgi:hypothetical protein
VTGVVKRLRKSAVAARTMTSGRLKHDREKCEAVFRKDHARTMSVATSRHDTSLDIPVKVALPTAKYDVLALQAR